MSQAKALFDAGKLDQAIEALIRDVKTNPSDVANRTFLFELSCFAGDWTRAERQLDVIGHQSTQAELGVMIYRANIKAEQERRRLFSEGVQPHFLREPPSYVDLYVSAINQMLKGQFQEARATLDHAEEARPAIAGKLGEKEFTDFRDYDDFVAPVLELIVKDKYVWLPFEQIKRMEIAPPKTLRNLLWANARVEAMDGTIGEVYVPSLYAGTSDNENDQTKLGRNTDWKQLADDLYRSFGLRLFAVDGEETSFFEATVVEFYPSDLLSDQEGSTV
ncbi:MAG TPA: type VI secretion system accessory protein TagJ [Pyrinomonadaceae bacterium]|nr:type VI secretion system accessory protein TagJ [Pyrinomonadaceae bacterium]